MKRVVIESPFAGDVERHVEYARQCMRDSLLRNEAPIASHLLYTQPGLLNDSIYAERQLGIEAGYVWMLRADLVAFYVNFGWSPGMLDARAFAESINLPITVRLITCAPPIK